VGNPLDFNDVEGAAIDSSYRISACRVLDIVQSELAGLSLSVTETAQTEINGKHLRFCESSRGFDRMLARAAASYQNFDTALLSTGGELALSGVPETSTPVRPPGFPELPARRCARRVPTASAIHCNRVDAGRTPNALRHHGTYEEAGG
jgi:hypothetical protein